MTSSHAHRGRFFEDYLELLHARYRIEGAALIDRIPTPTKPIPHGGGVQWVPLRKGLVDFIGVLAGGRMVAFDAKTCEEVTGWRVKTSLLSPKNDQSHQWEYLADVHALGGLAFYLIYASKLDRVYLDLLPFSLEGFRVYSALLEVPQDGDGWWDWHTALARERLLEMSPPEM